MATRHERVVLSLQDDFTTGMARAAAAAALLNRELNSLSKDSVRTRSAVSDIDRPIQTVGRSAGSSSREVDKLSGRMRILADVAAVLGPALVPIGAVGIPAATGLASQLGFAATAAGTAVLAFQGMGGALKALNAAALDPTQENLQKAQVALESLTPAAQDFVAQIGHMLPELRRLQAAASDGFFPGASRGLAELEEALPRVQSIVSAVATELGRIAGDTGASLASDRWAPFLAFVAREAPSALADMAKAAGNTAHAVASLWMATDPLNDDFSTWLVHATADIDRWASSLSKTQGFADFVAYVETTGPKVAAALGAIANAAVQILQAAAPLGGPVLEGIKALADLVSAIADSDFGTPIFTAVAAMALLNRSLALAASAQRASFGGPALAAINATSAKVRGLTADVALLGRQTSLVRLPGKGFIGPLTEAQTAMSRVQGSAKTLGKASLALGGLAIATSGVADNFGLANTAAGAMTGSLAGPWGAAVGGAVGLLLDAAKSSGQFADELHRADDAIRTSDVSKLTASLDELKRKQDAVREAATTPPPPRAQSRAFLDLKVLGDKADEVQSKLDMTKARAEQDLLADGFVATAAGIDSATTSTKDFQREIERLNEVLTGRASFRDFEQSIDDFASRAQKRAELLGQVRQAQADLVAAKTPAEKEAARQRIKDLQSQADALKNTLDVGKQAGRDTQEALDNIAATALRVAQGLDPIKRAEFLAGARSQFIKAAIDAGHTRQEAKKLADTVLGLSAVKGQPRIVIDADGAWRVIDETARRLSRLTRQTYKLNIKAQAGAIIPQVLDAQAHADGGTVQGVRWPYRDKVLAYLAPGEEVITNRNGEADRFRADRAAGLIPAYANGGQVQPIRPSMAGGIDLDRLAALIAARSQPLYGDVHVTDGYGGFKRQMEQDRRLASIGGTPV